MKKFLTQNGIAFKEDVPLARLTGMNQSGIVSLIVYPESEEQLIKTLSGIRLKELSFDIFGALTNTYLCEGYRRDVLVVTTQMRHVTYDGKTVFVESGYSLTKLSRELSEKSIAGFDGFIGIPGTVGAAAINNSGAFRSSMAKVVKTIKVVDTSGNITVLHNADMKYAQRTSILKGREGIALLSVELDISKIEDKAILEERISRQAKYRKSVIDGTRKSLGSVFVSSSMKELYKHQRSRIILKKIINYPLKFLFHSRELNKKLDFFFLGIPHLSKHCDSLNRFCWEKTTTEQDFLEYIDRMQLLAGGKLKLEIEIKR